MTLREHLEAILADLDSTKVSYSHGMLRAGEHAVAALAILDEYERLRLGLPDEEASS